jgi:AsmA-like C-terminal region/AsmA family
MKIVKRILMGFGILLVVVVAAAFIIPVVFKNDIKAAIDKAIAKNVNADVIFDVNNFSLSVFRHFPNVTAEIKDLGVFNRAPFEGTHLFVVDRMDIEVNLKDLLFGDQMRLKGITLVRPQINISVLKDGSANYNITYPPSDTVKAASSEPGNFSFGIDHWEIIDGEVSYDDKSLPYFMSIKGLQHTGSGDFSQASFDLKTHTVADTLTTSYGTMELLTNKRVEIDAVISISEDISKFTFKENTAKINDFALSFDGWFKMNEKDFGMDIKFSSPENSFKSLLSIVPGMYTRDFGKIETKGDLSFAGFVKGTYSDQQMPAFNLNLKVNDAMFKYPDLPTAITNINMDLLVDNKDGIINNTLVDLKKLHLDFGSNPVDARLLIENLRDYRMEGNVKAKLNLAELSKMFPMDGLEMRGIYSVDASAKGVYDSVRKVIPAVNASMSLVDGYAKSSKFPIPLEGVKFDAIVKNTSGKMAETLVTVKDFSMLLDGEKLSARMTLQNLDDYTWDIAANGSVDLEKMTKIFPVAGMTISGLVKADIETKGKMSDVNAKRYGKLPTSGVVSMKNFRYTSKDLPYSVTLSQADVSFDPAKVQVKQMSGTIGKSDFSVNGIVTNYLSYVLNKETINGSFNFNSTLFDLNEFMTPSAEPAAKDTATFGVVTIPKNIDFTLRSNLKTIKMMDYVMTNATGDILVKNGIANMNGVKFTMLDGSFAVSGSYNPTNVKHPKFDMGLIIDNLSIQKASASFSIIKTYAPIAGSMSGRFGVDFKINGELTEQMGANLPTINGSGLVKIAEAGLTQSKLISGVTALTKLNDTDNVTLKNVTLSVTIVNGRASVKPFDVKFGDYITSIAGSAGLDGSIDYTLKMNVPAGAVGAQYQALLNQYGGTNNSTRDIPVAIGVGGTYKNPKTTLNTQEQKEQAKTVIKNVAEEKGKELIKEAVKGTDAKDIVNGLLGGKKTDTAKVKKDSVKAPPTPVDQATDVLQNKLQNLLKKKKKG